MNVSEKQLTKKAKGINATQDKQDNNGTQCNKRTSTNKATPGKELYWDNFDANISTEMPANLKCPVITQYTSADDKNLTYLPSF